MFGNTNRKLFTDTTGSVLMPTDTNTIYSIRRLRVYSQHSMDNSVDNFACKTSTTGNQSSIIQKVSGGQG